MMSHQVSVGGYGPVSSAAVVQDAHAWRDADERRGVDGRRQPNFCGKLKGWLDRVERLGNRKTQRAG